MFKVENVPFLFAASSFQSCLKKQMMNERYANSAVANVTIRSTKYTQQSASKGIYSHLLVSKGMGRY